METLVQRLDTTRWPLAGHLLIVDLHGCTAVQLCRLAPYLRQLYRLMRTFYPELIGRLLVLRAPSGTPPRLEPSPLRSL